MSVGFTPIVHPTLDTYLFRPVISGMWTHKDIITDVFTFHDLLDIHEILDTKEANELAYKEYLEITNGV